MTLHEYDKPNFWLQWNTIRKEVPLKILIFQIFFCQPYLLSSPLLIAKILEYLPILISILISHFLFNLLQSGYWPHYNYICSVIYICQEWGSAIDIYYHSFLAVILWISIRNFILFILKLYQKRSLFFSKLFGYY